MNTIKRNDLRTGNYVQTLFVNSEIQEIYTNSVLCKLNSEKCLVYPYKELSLIPITEDWLVKKFGFEKEIGRSGKNQYSMPYKTRDAKFRVVHISENVWLPGTVYKKEGFNLDFISSIHQLQNNYFILSNGDELTTDVLNDPPGNKCSTSYGVEHLDKDKTFIYSNPDFCYNINVPDEFAKALSEFKTRNVFIADIDVFKGVYEILRRNGFKAFSDCMANEETGCRFEWKDICKYESVLAFQLDWPYA